MNIHTILTQGNEFHSNNSLRQLVHCEPFTPYFRCQSKTLTSALNYTVGNNTHVYNSEHMHNYAYLMHLCKLITGKSLQFLPSYNLITSDDTANLTLENALNRSYTAEQDKTHIYCVHIPKGKSYLKPLLDNNTEIQRIKGLENLCIENPFHFVRAYYNYPGTNTGDIVIFSDRFSENMIDMIFLMLPNLLKIEKEASDKTKALYNIFEIIYTATKNEITPEQYEGLTREAVNNYIKLFNLNEQYLKEFTTNIATQQRKNIIKNYTSKLDSISREITTKENALIDLYNNQHTLQLQLNALNLVNEEISNTFLNMLTNTKAIEILTVTQNAIKLRVTAPFQYFKEEDFVCYENNPNSRYNEMFKNKPLLKSVLHKVFVTREYKLLAQAIVNIQTNNSNYNNDSPIRVFAQTIDNTDFTECPNPHLYRYDCWNEAKTEIAKNANAGNYDLVLIQIIAAVQSVHIAENASFVSMFLNELYENDYHTRQLMHFIAEDGNIYDYKGILDHEQELQLQQSVETPKEPETTPVQQETPTIYNPVTQEYTQVEIPDDDWDDEEIGDYEDEEN